MIGLNETGPSGVTEILKFNLLDVTLAFLTLGISLLFGMIVIILLRRKK